VISDLLPGRVRIRRISWDVWVFFAIFVWIGIFHILFSPAGVREKLLLEWLPQMVKNAQNVPSLGKDLEDAVYMSSSLTFTLLDITLRTLAWWFSTYVVIRYATSRNGISAIIVPFKEKYMLVADSLKVYRKMILSATFLASFLYGAKDYSLYMLMTMKGIDPASAGWLFIVNLGGIISMVIVTIIWTLLPTSWLAKLWLVRAAIASDKETILSIDITPRTFIGYFIAFTMVATVVVLITYPSALYFLPLAFIPLFIEWWLGGFLVSILIKIITGWVKPRIAVESEGILV